MEYYTSTAGYTVCDLEEDQKIKPEGIKWEFSQFDFLEIKRCREDIVYFAETYVYVESKFQGAVKIRLFDYQKHMLRCWQDNKLSIAMLPRQSGKTQLASIFILWWACFKKNQKILIASKDQDGADEIMDRMWYAYEELPWFIKPGVRKNDVKTKTFENRSRIKSTATTPTSGRGKSNNLIYLDEFSFVRPSVAEPFWTSIFPTISGLGHCIITSTPNTDEDKFAKIWFNAKPYKDSIIWRNQFLKEETIEVDKTETLYETDEVKKDYSIKKKKITVVNEEDSAALTFVSFYSPWTRVPTKLDPITGEVISYQGEAFKDMNFAAGIDDTKWQAEYECQFITTDNTLISGQKLATLNYFTRVPKFIDKWGCRWYEKIQPNTTYGVVMDPSGDGVGDDAAIQVWEMPTLKQVAEWNTNTADQNEQARMLKRVLQRLYYKQQENPDHDGSCNIYFSVERNAIGIGIIRLIEMMDERTFPGIFIDATIVSTTARGQKMGPVPWNRHRGLVTTPATKKRFAQDLKSLIERNLFTVRSEFLASQLKTFIKYGPTYKAKEGSKDDLVMSAILMVHLLEELRNLEDDLDDYISPIIEDDYPVEDDDIFLPQMV